jgi:hypothetical protein
MAKIDEVTVMDELTSEQLEFITILQNHHKNGNITLSDIDLAEIEKSIGKTFDWHKVINPLIDKKIIDYDLYTHQNMCFWLIDKE